MPNVAEKLRSLDVETVNELDGALDALEQARDLVAQASFLGEGGELFAVIARERAAADHEAAARRLAELVLDAARMR